MSNKQIKTINWTSELFLRQLTGDKRKVNSNRRYVRGYKLSTLIPNRGALKHVFLGFSIDGNFVFSYTYKSNCSVHTTELVYTYQYKLNVWNFSPNKKLEKVFSQPLFGHAPIREELYLIFAQFPTLPSTLLILGHQANVALSNESKKCWTSATAFFNVISLKHLLGHKECFINENSLESHSFSLNFSLPVTVSLSMMLICLLPSNVCIINSGTNLYAFRFNGSREYEISDKSCSQFLHACGSCLLCEKRDVLQLCPCTCLEIEQCLQYFCEILCKKHDVLYIGFRDYESYVVEDFVDINCVLLLIGVLMEIEDDNDFYWEAVFTLSWNLATGTAETVNYKTRLQTILKTDINKNGWDRMSTMKKTIREQRLPSSKLKSPHMFTNFAVLRHKSVTSICDVDGMCAIML